MSDGENDSVSHNGGRVDTTAVSQGDIVPLDMQPGDAASQPLVKRGPGKPKGYPKPIGSGRVKGKRELDYAKERYNLWRKSGAREFLADILANREIVTSASTGKTIKRRPTIQERLKALQMVLERTMPSLVSQELSGKDGSQLFPAADSATLAKAVFEWVSAEPKPVTIDETTATAVIDSEQFPDDPALPPENFGGFQKSYEQFENGAKIEQVDVSGNGKMKWLVTDGRGVEHGFKADRAQAELLARNLPSYETGEPA